jgi:hypothetical protein
MAKHYRDWLPYEEARAFVRKLNLKNNSDWLEYCDIGDKPINIPKTPETVYRNQGWSGLGDWLGTGTKQTQKRQYLSFEDARKFVHTLHLQYYSDWPAYCTSGQKPSDIPSSPGIVYKDKGWIGFADWLGIGSGKKSLNDYLPFEEARALVRKQRIKTIPAWRAWCKTEKRPENIPANPNYQYKEKGWIGWRDWLGPI